jgi:hypothetical protein
VLQGLNEAIKETDAGRNISQLERRIELNENGKTMLADSMEKKAGTPADTEAWRAKMKKTIELKTEKNVSANKELEEAKIAIKETEAHQMAQEATTILNHLEDKFRLRTAYRGATGLMHKDVGGNEAVVAGRKFEERLFEYENSNMDASSSSDDQHLQIRALMGVLASTSSALGTGADVVRRQQLALHSVGADEEPSVDGEPSVEGCESGGTEAEWRWFRHCHRQSRREPQRWTAACKAHGLPDYRLLKNLQLWKHEERKGKSKGSKQRVDVPCGEVDVILLDAAAGVGGQIELMVEQKTNCVDITKACKQLQLLQKTIIEDKGWLVYQDTRRKPQRHDDSAKKSGSSGTENTVNTESSSWLQLDEMACGMSRYLDLATVGCTVGIGGGSSTSGGVGEEKKKHRSALSRRNHRSNTATLDVSHAAHLEGGGDEIIRRSVILTKTRKIEQKNKVAVPSPIIHDLFRALWSLDLDSEEHMLYLGHKIATVLAKSGTMSAQEVVDTYKSAGASGSILLFRE